MTASPQSSGPSVSSPARQRAEDIEISVLTELGLAEERWRALERRAHISAYQRFDFLASWQETLGARTGVDPQIVIGSRDGRDLFLLPLGLHKLGAFRILAFLGGKHANFNLGLFDCGCMETFSPETMQPLLQRIGTAAGGADAFALENMPIEWRRRPNPLVLPGSTPAPSAGLKGPLDRDFDALLMKQRGNKSAAKTRRKLRRLQEAGTVRFQRLDGPAEMTEAVGDFLEQKRERFRRLGKPNEFEVDGSREFLLSLVSRSAGSSRPSLELYTLTLGGKTYAVYGGSACQGRFSAYFSSVLEDELIRYGPGEHLLNFLVEECCRRGLQTFDLGVGEADYKLAWCKTKEPLAELFHPLTVLGRAFVSSKTILQGSKRVFKQTPWLWEIGNRVRRVL